MLKRRRSCTPLADRGPLRILFVITSMPIGGAETLLVNLVQRLDRDGFLPELCCLKEPGPLAETLAGSIPTHSRLLSSKYDLRVFARLSALIRQRRIDAVVTVGAGDKMFWGRLAAWWQRVPVVLSALHSTGWPDAVGRLNRTLTPLTDRFIAVAEPHGRYMVDVLGFPANRVAVIPNGVDTQRFRPQPELRRTVRRQLRIPDDAPLCGIVAALRPEKYHELFLRVAADVQRRLPTAHFLIIGDGPQRSQLERLANGLNCRAQIHFLGARTDIPELLAALDLFALTSRNEANPVSVLEALACGVPVVAPRVGSLGETVIDGQTGYLVAADDAEAATHRWLELLSQPDLASRMGQAGRRLVIRQWSLESMVAGYERLVTQVYESKCARAAAPARRSSAVRCGRAGEEGQSDKVAK
jgi:glycosyltransferase involved in cell wall biosynthesis